MSASIDNNVNTEYVTCTQDSDKGPTISKWVKYKAIINRNRRNKYKLDPEYEKSRLCKIYHCNPSPVKQRSYKSYHTHPSSVKQCSFEAYHAHPSPVKQCSNLHSFEAYHAHPSLVK